MPHAFEEVTYNGRGLVEKNESLVQITYHVLHLGSKLFDVGFDAIFFRVFSKSGG
jgi:hypothetical protein